MKNFVFISPQFPSTYYRFCKALKENGFRVLGIGDSNYWELSSELKESLDEYYQCYDMDNFDNEVNAVRYFEGKYGHIDYLESNNEYWLDRDAKLRQIFSIDTGIIGDEIDLYQHKSMMKEKYREAGVKVAKFILIDTYENAIKFIDEVGYPVFIKPDKGVGAAGDYKIQNIEDLQTFFAEKCANVIYICEQYITGNIISFDGVCDSNSDVIFCTSECFPPSVSAVKKEGLDFFYYCLPNVPDDLIDLGKRVIKTFGIKNRFFHCEFFRLLEPIKGVGEPGDIIGLETNMRPPGGYTPDLINFANSVDIYRIYADSMAFDKTYVDLNKDKFFASCASRRDGKEYFYSEDDILRTFKNQICWYGRYPDILSDCMGNVFYMAKFENLDDVELFHQYVNKRVGDSFVPKAIHTTINKRHKDRYGEGYRIVDSKKSNNNSSVEETICDKNIDGA